MSEYIAARSRTRAKIERAFWDLYLETQSERPGTEFKLFPVFHQRPRGNSNTRPTA